jgi:hypothetical protein
MDDSSFFDRILSNLHFQRSYQRAGDTLCVRGDGRRPDA